MSSEWRTASKHQTYLSAGWTQQDMRVNTNTTIIPYSGAALGGHPHACPGKITPLRSQTLFWPQAMWSVGVGECERWGVASAGQFAVFANLQTQDAITSVRHRQPVEQQIFLGFSQGSFTRLTSAPRKNPAVLSREGLPLPMGSCERGRGRINSGPLRIEQARHGALPGDATPLPEALTRARPRPARQARWPAPR